MGLRVLVTGGAGFIGSHVSEAYLADGWEVTALDDLSGGRRENVADGAEFVEMDIRSPELSELLRRRRFDVVNHHAAQVDVRVSVASPRCGSTRAFGFVGRLFGRRRARRPSFHLFD